MLGAIIGDIVGSRFEGWTHGNPKSKEFEFFHKHCKFTDDSVLTLATAYTLLNCKSDYSDLTKTIIKNFIHFTHEYTIWCSILMTSTHKRC